MSLFQINPLPIPLCRPVQGSIRIKGSKSLTNRALFVASLSSGISRIIDPLFSEDTTLMIRALESLECGFEELPPPSRGLLVAGRSLDGVYPERSRRARDNGGKAHDGPFDLEIDVGNAGTLARFLLPALTLMPGKFRTYGKPAMHQRPIGGLVEALRSLGADIEYLGTHGSLPLRVTGGVWTRNHVELDASQSSQFASALMMAAPYLGQSLRIDLPKGVASAGYLDLTCEVMTAFGVIPQVEKNSIFIPESRGYQACTFAVEADASSASYFAALAAVTGGRISIQGVKHTSGQSDAQFFQLLERMGCQCRWLKDDEVQIQGSRELRAIDVDMNTTSDVAPTLAVCALFAEGKTRIRNVKHMRYKECNRIEALVRELSKLGAHVEEFEDGLSIEAKSPLRGAQIITYDDHRMAMSFAIAGARIPGVLIENPSCVAKTYPEFFDDWFRFSSSGSLRNSKINR